MGATLFTLALNSSVAEIACRPAALPGNIFIVPIGTLCIQTLCTAGNKLAHLHKTFIGLEWEADALCAILFPLCSREKYQKRRKLWAINSAVQPACSHELRTGAVL